MALEIKNVPLEWRNEEEMSYGERMSIALLRVAGCNCELPLLGYVMGDANDTIGPRCRLCNTKVRMIDHEM